MAVGRSPPTHANREARDCVCVDRSDRAHGTESGRAQVLLGFVQDRRWTDKHTRGLSTPIMRREPLDPMQRHRRRLRT